MKKKNLLIIALAAIITIGIICCGGDDTPKTFKVTFNANGGNPEPQPQKIEKGGKVTKPEAMTKADYSFDGWYEEISFSNLWDFANNTVFANIILHAKWTDQPKVKPDILLYLPFDGIGYKVTIKSDEKFTSDEWSTLYIQIETVIMRGYNKDMGDPPQNIENKNHFKKVFESDQDAEIVLLNTADYNCEVKSDNYRKVYLKTSAIDTVDFQPVVKFMYDESDPLYQQ